ncbi:MAG: HAD family hydrolase [Paracoccus sp. (in: a-proteobacteria)]|uniref:HAD family hydrolase n=1 Tax=Paracoccus sp. TaxID=267 RepID=UPI00391C6619
MVNAPKAILFDLDDTILTEGDRLIILLLVAEKLAHRLVPYSPVAIAHALENALEAFWSSPTHSKTARLGSHIGIRQARELVISNTLQKLNLPDTHVGPVFCDLFSQARTASARMYDGARITLETFRQMNVRLALVTNGAADVQREKLERFNLTPLFDHVQIEGEMGFGKPDEQTYLHAMKAMDVEPAGTWMVGDNLEWEVAAPQRLGIRAIWHDHRRRGLPPDCHVQPDHIILEWSELLPLICRPCQERRDDKTSPSRERNDKHPPGLSRRS